MLYQSHAFLSRKCTHWKLPFKIKHLSLSTISRQTKGWRCTLRKSIGPFAIYSYKSEIFILLEMNLKIGKFKFSWLISFNNYENFSIYSFLLEKGHNFNFCGLPKLRNRKKVYFIKWKKKPPTLKAGIFWTTESFYTKIIWDRFQTISLNWDQEN